MGYHYVKKITIITLALALSACANTDELDANISSLTNKVDALSAKVEKLEIQQQSIAADVLQQKMLLIQLTNVLIIL